MKKIIFLILLLISITISVKGQDEISAYDRLNMPSANAAVLKSFSEVPVSPFTGKPQISVPIYTIDLNYIEFPINLSYDASGFKPDVHPSWVGMGWNLNAGGVITREVQGFRDELYNAASVTGSQLNGLGFYYSYKVLSGDDWNDIKKITPNGVRDKDSMNEYLNSPNKYYPTYLSRDIDQSQDIFSFNFLGYSGKFFLNHKREWKVRSDQPIKVIFDDADMAVIDDQFTISYPTFTKFTLIDEKGVKYIFGGKDAIEYSVSMTPPFYDYKAFWIATSWHLKEIQMPDGQKINLDYERGPMQSQFGCTLRPTKVAKKTNNLVDSFKASNYVYYGQIPISLQNDYPSLGSAIGGSVISPVYLTKIHIPKHNLAIEFNTSKSNELSYFETTYTDRFYCPPDAAKRPVDEKYLNFDPTLEIPYYVRHPEDKAKIKASTFKERFIWLKLDEIKFKYNGTESQTLKFYYMENPEKRLRLDSVSTIYPNSNTKETYGFEYNYNLPYPKNQEYEYLSEYADHWGFSNMKFFWNTNESDQKAPMKDRAKFGVLNKIIYPTKGYTLFFYEDHDYSSRIQYTSPYLSPSLESLGSNSDMAGGLRIKKILNIDNFGGHTSKEYIYKKNYGNNEYISSGILRHRPIYKFGDNRVSPDGIHLVYNHVIEKYENGSFKAMTFTSEDYGYRLDETTMGIVDNNPVGGAAVWGGYVPHSDRSFERGKPLDEYYCNNLGKIMRSKHYFYTNINNAPSDYVRTVDMGWDRIIYSSRLDPGFTHIVEATGYTAYYQFVYQNKLTSIKEVEYSPDSNLIYYYNAGLTDKSALTKEQSFGYDSYGQLVNTISSTSDGKQKKNTIKYPYTDNPTSGILSEMVTNNMLSYPVEQKSYMNSLFLKGAAYTYAKFGNNILLSKIEDIDKDDIKSLSYQNTKYSNGRLIERKYNTDLVESYLWDLEGRQIMAVVKNYSIDELSKILPNGYTPMGVLSSNYIAELNTLKANLPTSVHLKTYDYYLDGNLKQEGSPNGLNSYYEYDKNKRLETIKDHDGNAVTGFSYNYSDGQKPLDFYLNEEMQVSAAKLCDKGYVSEPYYLSFLIPPGEMISYVSQEDANNKAKLKYQEEHQLQAENECRCIRYGIYDFQKISNTAPKCDYELQSSSIMHRGDDIEIAHLALVWKTIEANIFSWYHNDSKGIIIGEIIGDRYPTTIKYMEFKDQRRNKLGEIGNSWIMSIDPVGTIRVKLKSPSDEMPKVGEQINFSLIAPIFK